MGATAPLGPNGKTVASGAAAQAQRCFEIIQGALHKLGVGLGDVVRTRILPTRIADWEPDWLIEVEVDAYMAEK